jgi:hypothetical protein
MDLKRISKRGRARRYLVGTTLAMALTMSLSVSSPAQSASSQHKTFATAVSKSGRNLDLRSAGRYLRDQALGRVRLERETIPTFSPLVQAGKNPLRGPNTQVNDPALDNIQIFSGFRPFLHYTQSETTVAAHGQDIVVSYNNSAGITLAPSGSGLVFTRVQISGYSFSNDGGRTWTSDYVPAPPGVGPFTFGDGVVTVDRRGNFYYASLGSTADGHGAVVLNISTDGGRTFGPGLIAAVDDGSDKEWIAVGPDPSKPGHDNIYITWTSFTSTGSEVAFAVSKDGGATFQSKIIFAPGPDPDPTHPQNAVQFTNPVVDRSNGRLYVPFAHFSNSNTDFLQMMVSDDAGQTFSFANFNIPGALDPTLIPLVQPGTFEDCGNGGFRLAIVEGSDIGGGQFGLPRFVQSSRLTVQPALAVENGNVFFAYNASDSPFFGDPTSGSNIFLLRSTDGGQTWIGPQQVNPTVSGDPRHVYPAIAIQSAGQKLDVSYFAQHTDGTVDLDLVSTGRSSNFALGNATRITTQSFDLVPSNIPIPTPTNPFRTTNFDRDIVPCYDLGEYVGLFNNKGSVYATWGGNPNQVTEPTDPLDPLSGQTHAQPDTFFQQVKPKK